MANQREEILNQIYKVQSLPASAVNAIHKLRDENANLNAIADSLKTDPGLTANILRLANSAAFSAARKLSSLNEAAMRLGAALLGQLILTASLPSAVRGEIKGYDMPPGRLLAASLTSAFGIEELAKVLRIPQPPQAYTAGLLADIGKIVLGTYVNVDATPILSFAQRNNVSFDVAEMEVLGTDHAEVGAALLERWKLPSELVEIVRWHHAPESAPHPSTTLDLVHLSTHLSLLGGQFGAGDGLRYRISNKVVERWPLKRKDVEQAICRTSTRVEQIQKVL